MTVTDDPKTLYRIEAKRHRERMDIRDEDPDDAAENFLRAIKPQKGQVVGVYWPKGRELDTAPLMERLMQLGAMVALPVMQADTRLLSFALWSDDVPLEPASFGVMQPPVTSTTIFAEPDIVVVPMLAFDRRGHRLGYGGGYFDCTLEYLRKAKQVLAVGYAYSQQAVLFNLPAETHDQPLDWIITPKDVHSYCGDDKDSL